MKTGDIVRKLDLGNSVAEFDKELEKYFVETEPFRALIEDRADIIAGDKGTGKTALYSILRKRYGSIAQLKGVEVEPLAKLRGLRLGAVPNSAGEHPIWPGSPTWEDRRHAERWKSGVPTCSRPRVGTPVGD